MTSIFDVTSINGMELKNRLIRSATWEGMCDPEGRPTEKLESLYQSLALGGIGLIVSGYTFVRPEGRQLPSKMGMDNDDIAESHQKLTRIVHQAGGKIAVQLVHAGGQTNTTTAGRQPLAPSSIQVEQFPEQPAELTKTEINEIVAAFGASAKRAKAWGYDGVQLHGAHGYLINQFLSPLTNQRSDEYGGSFENRTRFLMDVYQEVRAQVGPDYPIMIKLNTSDNLVGGFELTDGIRTAELLSHAGIDAIEVSAGTPASGAKSPVRDKINKPEKEAYNLKMAKQVKEVVQCPVMVVGGMRSFEIVDRTVQQDGIDYISMARPFIREPDLPNRWLNGDHSKATCISCNGCFGPGLKEGGIYCIVEKKLREKKANQ